MCQSMKPIPWIALLSLAVAFGKRSPDRGVNLPPTQATTRDGAFFPGLYQYAYEPDYVAGATSTAGFTALRLAVNVETAHDPQSLRKHKAYLDAAGGRGIICMFDTSVKAGTSWPRTGRITDKVDKVASAWRSVHSVFSDYGQNVMYEIFNEPWGYQGDAVDYLVDMNAVISLAKLPQNRVILAGLYGSADVQSVARAGWTGFLAYHAYVFWLPEGQRTRENFKQKIRQDIAGLSSKVFITEFGVGLDGLKTDIAKYERNQELHSYGNMSRQVGDWQKEFPTGSNVKDICAKYPTNVWCKKHLSEQSLLEAPNLGADVAAHQDSVSTGIPAAADPVAAYHRDTDAFLKGMRDALLDFKKEDAGIRGLYHWHGWHNSDAWDFWDAANARSSRIIQMMMSDLGDGNGLEDTTDLFMSEDYVKDEQSVNIVVAHQLENASSTACPAECTKEHCQVGNIAEIGGVAMNWRDMVSQVCTFHASPQYNGIRYCGAGAKYETTGAIDCRGCAVPARCGGLPCWAKRQISGGQSSGGKKAKFLQRQATIETGKPTTWARLHKVSQ